jgi:aminoglycoside phosphotransferase (APT) family kinase protein
MPEPAQDPAEDRVAAYLAHRMPEAEEVTVTGLSRIPGGASQETYRFHASWREGGEGRERDLILRRAPEMSLVNPEHGMEYSVYRALQGTGVPVPKTLFGELDARWLDRPFFVMELVEGRPALIYGTGDPFDGKAREVGANFWRQLGLLAQQDAAILEDAELRGWDRQDRFWESELDHWEAILDSDEDLIEPIVRGAIRWLRANPPPEPARPAIVHGDYRVGNFLFLPDGQITAILDWEMCHIGDPLEDIAWAIDPMWSMEKHFPLEEGLALWAESSGLALDREALEWWRLFGTVKASALWTTSEKSFEEGHNREMVLALTALRAGPFHRRVILELMEQRGVMG